jgi:hypothetical protein
MPTSTAPFANPIPMPLIMSEPTRTASRHRRAALNERRGTSRNGPRLRARVSNTAEQVADKNAEYPAGQRPRPPGCGTTNVVGPYGCVRRIRYVPEAGQ